MAETWNGTPNNDVKSATKSGIWPVQWWTNWIMDGKAGNDTLRGGEDNDQLTGNTGNDTLRGLGGNDILDGAGTNAGIYSTSGIDSMYGGKGDDSYYVDNSFDFVSELFNEGTDTVYSYTSSYTLTSNVEKLILRSDMRGSGFTGIGNNLNNEITGNHLSNTLRGMDGNDTIFAMAGIDTAYGGNGDDTLYGGGDGDSLYGEANHDFLFGGAGDKMYGGTGNDTYTVTDPNNNGASIIELSGEGVDTIVANFSPLTGNTYTLAESLIFVEGVRLEGAASRANGNSYNNTLTGNVNANSQLYGYGGNDKLYGRNFNDTLVGGFGSDEMYGYAGDDLIYGSGSGMDRMVGGLGADHFSLGDSYRDATHVVIQDFTGAQRDNISLQGTIDQYTVGIVNMAGSVYKQDLGIYYKPTNDLVAVIQDNTALSLNGPEFRFFAT